MWTLFFSTRKETMKPEKFRKLPDDIIRYVSEWMTEVKYRNGRYMCKLNLCGEPWNELRDCIAGHQEDLERDSMHTVVFALLNHYGTLFSIVKKVYADKIVYIFETQTNIGKHIRCTYIHT